MWVPPRLIAFNLTIAVREQARSISWRSYLATVFLRFGSSATNALEAHAQIGAIRQSTTSIHNGRLYSFANSGRRSWKICKPVGKASEHECCVVHIGCTAWRVAVNFKAGEPEAALKFRPNRVRTVDQRRLA